MSAVRILAGVVAGVVVGLLALVALEVAVRRYIAWSIRRAGRRIMRCVERERRT